MEWILIEVDSLIWNNFLESSFTTALVSSILGSLVGGAMTWFVTSNSLKKEREIQSEVLNQEQIKKDIVALNTVKYELKNNLDNFHENCSQIISSRFYNAPLGKVFECNYEKWIKYNDDILYFDEDLFRILLKVYSDFETILTMDNIRMPDVVSLEETIKEAIYVIEESVDMLKQKSLN